MITTSLIGRVGLPMVAVANMLLFAASANAVEQTYDISFSASSFVIGSGADPAPVDPVTGSLTVSLDPALTYTDETSGISLHSLNIVLGSTISFSFDPDIDNGLLIIGGFHSGADGIQIQPSTDDFVFATNAFLTTPAFDSVSYSQTSVSSNNFFYTDNQTGSLSVTLVPEPTSAALLCVGTSLLLLHRR